MMKLKTFTSSDDGLDLTQDPDYPTVSGSLILDQMVPNPAAPHRAPAPPQADMGGNGDAPEAAGVTSGFAAVPTVPAGLTELQLNSYDYATSRAFGSNIQAAWKLTSGLGAAVAVVDDGFDPATTNTFAQFSQQLSRNFTGAAASGTGEPAGGFHGTATSGVIGASGANRTPVGIAPNATVVGAKVSFGSGSFSYFIQAEAYAASVAGVVNNSWGFTGYGVGQPGAGFSTWYAAIQTAVQTGRGGLGTSIVFAAGNDRGAANDLAVQPITADYRVISVAATDAAGNIASYSTPGAANLVSMLGTNVLLAATGGGGSISGSGTSFAAPSVSAVAALMQSINPRLGWRDIQEILADSAYMPPSNAGKFTYDGAADWNGGGRHFSNDYGFGIVDANVAVNLARVWTAQSTSVNMATGTAMQRTPFAIGINATASSTVTVGTNIRIQHVQVTITDTYLPVAWSKITLIAPDGTRSVLLNQTGLVSGRDLTSGLDASGNTITSNAFWGESAIGTWTLQVQDIGGRAVGTISNWSLTFIGDSGLVAAMPLVFTPEFAALAAQNTSRTMINPGRAVTIDAIAMPNATVINLNGGAGMIDGVRVTLGTGLKNANAAGSLGSVTLTGLIAGGSVLSGGDGITVINGYGHDTIAAGLGTTAINTGHGGSQVTLSSVDRSQVSLTASGGDTIWAGQAVLTVNAASGVMVYAQSSTLTFINGTGSSVVQQGTGTVLIQAGAGGGTFTAGTGGNSRLTAGAGLVTFRGAANGDILTAGGSANDIMIAGGGNETLAGGSATGDITLIGGTGSTAMTAGLGKTTFVLGTGNDAVTTGGAADVIRLIFGQSGGFDTIQGFRLGTDRLNLVGYSANAAATALSQAASDGRGGTLFTFADSTRVDLLGIAHPTSGIFG